MNEATEIRIGSTPIQLDLDMNAMTRDRNKGLERRHCNTEYEILIVLRGCCEVGVGEYHCVLHAGQGILIAPERYHIQHAIPGPFDRFCFRFLPHQSELLTLLREKIPGHREFSASPEMAELALTLFDVFAGKGGYWRESFLTRLKLLLIDVLNALELGGEEAADSRNFYADKRATRIDRYIEEHMAADPSIDDLARTLHLSRRQTDRVLQENFGMGFRKKLLNARMDRAAWLLRTTETPIDVVAEEVGYCSMSAFYRSFRERYRMAPRQYRTKYTLI